MWTPQIIAYVLSAAFLWIIVIRALLIYRQEFSFLIKANNGTEFTAQWVFLGPFVLIAAVILSTGQLVSYGSDWFAYFLYHQVTLDSMKSGELLHWSPYISGGYPWAGHPDQPSLTPLMLPLLIFGTVFGLKVNMVVMFLLYWSTSFLLARKYLNLSLLSSAFVSGLVISSGQVVMRVYTQKYTNVFDFLTIPTIFFLLEALHGSKDNKPYKTERFWLFAAACVLQAVMLYQGKIDAAVNFVFIGIIFAYAFFKKGANRRQICMMGIGFFILSVLLAAPKILPMKELLKIDSRYVVNFEQLKAHIYTPSSLRDALFTYEFKGIDWVKANQIIGLGVVPLLLGIFGVIAYPRRAWIWLSVAVFFSFVGLGNNSFFPLGYYLWHLPILHNMEDLDKYFNFYIMFPIAILAGLGLEKLSNISVAAKRWAVVIALFWVAILTQHSLFYYKEAFPVPLPKYEKEKEFYFVQRNFKFHTSMLFDDYLYYMRNIGTMPSYTNIKIPIAAQPRYILESKYKTIDNRLYRGEAYFESGKGSIVPQTYKQNYIVLSGELEYPGIVVINQNSSPYWHASKGTIINDGSGLLKVFLNEPGKFELTVRNINLPFVYGVVLYALGVVLLGAVYRFFKKYPFKKVN